MISPGQGGYESLDDLATRLLMPEPHLEEEIGTSTQTSKSGEVTRTSTQASKIESRTSKLSGDEAPKRQKLQLEREKLNSISKAKILKVTSKKGLAGFEYICRTCDRHFKKRLRCLAHAKDCGEGSLSKGRKRKKSQRRSQCNLCSFEATTRVRLRAHRQAEHGGLLRRHRCTRCAAQFASVKSFVRHVRRHASKVAYPCPTNGSGLPMKLQFKDLVGHVSSHPLPLLRHQCCCCSPSGSPG